jgi:hypothetical protein
MEGETGRDRDLIVNLSDGLFSLTLVLFREASSASANPWAASSGRYRPTMASICSAEGGLSNPR